MLSTAVGDSVLFSSRFLAVSNDYYYATIGILEGLMADRLPKAFAEISNDVVGPRGHLGSDKPPVDALSSRRLERT